MDYISRTDAINALSSRGHFAAAKTLWDFPAADVVERKKGKWIFDGDCYKCNKCGAVYSWWADSQVSNYCPNCGARMTE